MAYVPGERMARPGPGDVDASCAFLADLHRLSALPAAAALPSASEACFSLQSVAGNIQARLDRLRALGPGLLDASGLGRFLAEELLPAWEAIRAQAADRARRWGIPLDRDLPAEARTLSPSDFGFHNALKADGKVFFLDFEYFGWDDPAKLLADFLLHPGMALDPGLRERFARGLLDQIPVPGLGERARLAYPLFGIKWCAILLNEFLPGPLHRRRFAAPGPLSPGECQAGQLAKCRAKLRQVVAENDHFILFPAPD
jgi:hypothetical protein